MSVFFDVAIIAAAVYFLWLGFKKGFFRSMIDLVIMSLSALIPYLFAPTLAEQYYNSFINDALVDKITDLINQNGNAMDSAKNILSLINNIPGFIQNNISVYGVTTHDILKILSGSGEKSLAIEELLKPTIVDIVTIFIFAILSGITFFILKFFFRFMFRLPKIPVFGIIDSILGLCMGALKLIVFTFLFVVIMKSVLLVAPQNEFKQNLISAIDDSKVFGIVYNVNIDMLSDYLKLY